MESVKDNNGVVAEDVQPQAGGPSQTQTNAGPTTSREAAAAAPAPDYAAERERLQREKSELQDLLVRRQAEFDNYRKRYERERGEVFDLAAMDVIRALLPVLDDFERALKHETTDKEYARGMELIYQRLLETLKKLGLEPIVNDVPVFNPHIHHAVDKVETKDYPDQTILEEYQRGYYYKGRLLRTAMVKVAINP
jgi:molecular chaperone GrpE